ncbi:MAG: bifunctional 4-hydroxy-2-oxoglutarate aldolase/2-dehydro-3-deoxy-phosphogluconate aldolase [Christensenellales bacterium]|jgi:2-dehydro-3-deoxyphosphogluconate aldolase/(4S)-4-hydroxy-2-oxoglutarate aldolase
MSDTLAFIKQHKIIAIMRKLPPEQLIQTSQALYDGGIRLMEITFDQKGDPNVTVESIKTLISHFGDKLLVGAGTVMSLEQLDMAYKAGAKYIISPDCNTAVIEKTKELGLVSMPGALTPTEIATAYNHGADIVKLFPAGVFGVDYVKAVRAPVSHVPLAAVGGITENNISDFIAAGISSFGLGSNIVRADLIKEGKFDEITALAALYVKKLEAVK